MTDYSTQTLDNPSWIKRFSHRARFQQALHLVSPGEGEHILDYGAGDGSLTLMLARDYPQAIYSLFEPTEELREQAKKQLQANNLEITVFSDYHCFEDHSFEAIVCQEVLEHLPDDIQAEALDQFQRLLASNGRLVISVPVEIGLSALFKNLVRLAVGQMHESSSLMNFIRATTGNSDNIPRVSRNGYIDSHLGFDYRNLERELRQRGWKIQQRIFSPIPWARGLFNSQVFYLLSRP